MYLVVNIDLLPARVVGPVAVASLWLPGARETRRPGAGAGGSGSGRRKLDSARDAEPGAGAVHAGAP